MPSGKPLEKNIRHLAGVLLAVVALGCGALWWWLAQPDMDTSGFIRVPSGPYEKDPQQRKIYWPSGGYHRVDADYDSFRSMDNDYWYARDRDHVFCKGGRLGDMRPTGFAKAPPLGDAGSPGISGSMYALDERNVYYCAEQLAAADAASFHYLADARDYGMDDRRVYYQSTWLPDADRATFEAVDPSWSARPSRIGGIEHFAKDERTLYYRDTAIAGPYDAATLRSVFPQGTEFYDKNALYYYDLAEGQLRQLELLPPTRSDRRIVPLDVGSMRTKLYRDADHLYLRWDGYRTVRSGGGRNSSRTAVPALHLVRLTGVHPDDIEILSPTRLRQKSPPHDSFFVLANPDHVGGRVGNCRSGTTLLRVDGRIIALPTEDDALKHGTDIAVGSPAWKREKCDNRSLLQALGTKLRHPFQADWPSF